MKLEQQSEVDLWCKVFVAGYEAGLRIPIQVAPSILELIRNIAIVADAAVEEFRKRH